MSKIPEKLGANYYRSFLTEQGKYFYDCIVKQLLQKDYSGVTSFTIAEQSMETSDCFAAYKAIRDDHPEFFFLGYQCEFTRIGNRGELKYSVLYDADIITRIRCQLRKTIYNIVRGTASLPILEREIVVYERIARKLSYANHGDVRDHNIVGPCLLSSGVCEGHNALLLLCLRRVGISCIKVYGKTKSDGWHCWTVAWIHGKPVHCDVTWDCNKNGIICFNYLNLSDRQIALNHFSFKNSYTPKCVSEEFSYYRYKGLCINSRFDLCKKLIETKNLKIPLLVHLNYLSKAEELTTELVNAMKEARITGNYSIQECSELRNVLVLMI